MGKPVRISVCLAAYNGQSYIAEQLTSILDQLGDEDEVIISDDHSTDGTVDVLKSFSDPRVKLYENNQNLGYTKNFEATLKRAQGRFIFLSDQDDVWLPGKVEAVLKALQQVDFVVTNAVITDGDLQTIHASHFALHGVQVGFLRNFLKTRYIGACMAMKREVLEKALPFPQDAKKAAHDYWLMLIAERFFKVGLIHEPYLLYRRHDSNASGGGLSKKQPLKDRIVNRLYCLLQLLNR